MEVKRELAERIRQIRTSAELNQSMFAESIGVSRVHLSHMEAPDYKMMPSKPVLKRLCDTYNVNYEWLMTGNGDIYKKNTEEDFAYNKNITLVSPALVEQTREYISLKASSLLTVENMEEKRFSRYFHLFTSLINLVFRLMDEIKNYYITRTEVPDEFYDYYVEEFRRILRG